MITATETYADTGSFNSENASGSTRASRPTGVVDMRSALQVSSDVYFYRLGIESEEVGEETGKYPIQEWAKRSDSAASRHRSAGRGRRAAADPGVA